MRSITRKFSRKHIYFFGVGILLCLVTFVAVFATSDERMIHVFPTAVDTDGWMKSDLALEQALSGTAVFSDFNRLNSAFVIAGDDGLVAENGEESGMVNDELGEETKEGGDASLQPTLDDTTQSPSATDDEVDDAQVTGDSVQVSDVTKEEEVPATPSQSPSTQGESGDAPTTDMPQAHGDSVRGPMADLTPVDYVGQVLYTLLGLPVFAQDAEMEDLGITNTEAGGGTESVADDSVQVSEQGSGDRGQISGDDTLSPTTDNLLPTSAGEGDNTSLPPTNDSLQTDDASPLPSNGSWGEDDVRSCTVLGIECHTITFAGFDIGSVLSDHVVKGYELRLSLATRPEGESFTPDKVLVRYFYRGIWHMAGEVTIDHELSNFDNGGHLAFSLPDLTSWDALKDLKVEVEYVRQGTTRTEVFLDSVWVDATYETQTADEPTPVAPNILAELKVLEDSGRPDLLLADDKRIELTKVEEDAGGDLVIRSDADVYSGLTTARAYFAVTNRSDSAQSFRLRTHLGQQAEVTRLQERMENVSEMTVTPSYSEVAYFCEGGWELESGTGMSMGMGGEGDELGSTNDALGETDDGGLTVDSDEVVSDEGLVTSEDDGDELSALTGDDVEADAANLQLTTANSESVDTGSDELGTENLEQTAMNSELPISNSEEVNTTNLEQPTPGSEDADIANSQLTTANSETADASLQPTLSTTYICKATGEAETCNSFNADKTNCIKGNERVSVDDTVRYEDGWQEVSLVDPTQEKKNRSILARLFGGDAVEVMLAPALEKVREGDKDFAVAPRETRYFAVDLSFSIQRAGEFVVEVVGDGEVNEAKSSWWRSAFQYRIPVTVTHPEVNASSTASTSSVPALYELSFDRSAEGLFTYATFDGSDVRFYDENTRTELPTKQIVYTYVDEKARYAVDLGDASLSSTSTVYMYFGNEHVFADDRVPAPKRLSAPIEYVGVEKPDNGVVLSFTSERDEVVLALSPAEEPMTLYYGHTRDLLVPDTESRVLSDAPILMTVAEGEHTAGVTAPVFSFPPHTQVTESRLPDGRTQYLLERYTLHPLDVVLGALEILPLPAVDAFEPTYQNKEDRVNYLRLLRGPRLHAFVESLKDFELGDQPEFKLQYEAQKGSVTRFLRGLFTDRLAKVAQVRLMRAGTPVPDATFEIVYGAEGQWTLKMTKVPRAIMPGVYALEITVDELGTVYTDSFDFYWGVLALNTPQSSYMPDDHVEFQMAALDDRGDTICDADLHLTVTTPSGVSEEVSVEQQASCEHNNVTDEPDYRAWFMPREVGTYTLSLAHVNLDGDVVHRVSDSIEVRESVPFVVRRTGATRIWPIAEYTMTLEVTSAHDFTGQFVEAVPNDFVVVEAGGARTDAWGGANRLVWDVELTAGETQQFSYTYDAPDISPYLYLLGPAEVRAESGLPYVEERQWKLASDAVGSMLLYWDQTTIPTGWTCVSCNSGDPFYQRFVMGSSTAGVNGGAATSTHTATGTVATQAGTTAVDTNNQATPQVAHTHTYTPSIIDASNLPPYRQLVLIQYATSGEPASIPAGAIALFDVASSSLPAGWNRYNDQDGKFIRSEATSTIGTATGSETHTHTIAGNTGAAAVTVNIRNPGTTVSVAAAAHTHSVSGVTGSGNNVPPYREAVLARLSATSTPANSMIAMWTADPSHGWTVVSSSSDAFENRFVRASTTYGAVGGTTTHTHADVSGIVSGTPSAVVNRDSTPATTNVAPAGHTHVVNVGGFSTIAHVPPYRTAVFAKRSGGLPPAAPTYYDVPFNNIKTASSSPYLDFSTTDTDSTDTLVYQVSWSNDPTFTASTTRTSDDETGCSPDCFKNITTPADISPFSEGERIRFSIQDTLTTGTTYYWRVRAKETVGNEWGTWSVRQSFTYIEDTVPSQWFQTEDAQFDGNTFSGAETFGEDAVRIQTVPPMGAMVAYGEGTAPTPMYRIWNGTAWSASSSALEVTGQVSWTVLRAAPTRNEYVLGTQTATGTIVVQVYNGDTGVWGNKRTLTGIVAGNPNRRAFDIAYQSVGGTAVVAFCYNNGTNYDADYVIWDGASWSATSTDTAINLQFNAACDWVKLAASPATDEVMMVAQATSTNSSTGDFEAQVYRDESSKWNITSYAAGANTANEEFFERMSVAYEGESGNDAVVAFGNGGTGSFVNAVWDSTLGTWTTLTARGSVNDFEWGELTADEGTDNMALCLINEDDQAVLAKWDGSTNAWDAYDAAGDLLGTSLGGAAGDYHARPVSCQFETTAGRDGYLMTPYSGTAANNNSRYGVWNGTTLSTANGIAGMEDSWTIGTARTGDGKILAVFRDNSNARYDFSYWNGSGWSSRTNLGTSVSVTAAPYNETIVLAAQRYQAVTGSVVSPIIDFDLVSGYSTWGEVLWNTTEPVGTEVRVRVYYATTTAACNVPIPGAYLDGNDEGFSATSSPLNLSGLSTSTYNMLCLKATLSSQSATSPTLDDWTMSWTRAPYLTQSSYRWYVNEASYTPSDPWPSGGVELNKDTPITGEDLPPKPGDVLRLRMSVAEANVALPAVSKAFRLQYAQGSVCSADLAWYDVAPASSTTAPWRGYANTITSSDWYDSAWSGRLAITLDEAQVDEDLTDFPVYVNLATLGSDFWAEVQSAGGDIRITSDDGVTEVPREVVSASTTTQTGDLYFKAPSVSSTTDTVFYLYFGNSGASEYAVTDTYGARNVWTGFDAVYHLGEEGNTSAGGYLDSTANVKHGTGVSMTSTSDVAGKLGTAQTFDGAADYISLPSGLLDLPTASSPKTVTAWVKFSGTDDPVVTSRSSTDGDPLLSFNAGYDGVDNSGGNPSLIIRDSTGGGGYTHVHSSVAVNDNSWHHTGYTINTSKAIAIYVDATQRGSATHTIAGAASGMNIPAIGAERRWIQDSYGSAGQRYALGDIDEVRISSSVRSNAWIKAEYQNGQGTLVSSAGAESLGDGFTIPSALLNATNTLETYEEENDSVANPNALPVGQEGEWDWVVQNNTAEAGAGYCFRMVKTDGTDLNAYTRYPQLVTNDAPDAPQHLTPFDNSAVASSSPWFEFVANDAEGDALRYNVQVSTDILFDVGDIVIDRDSAGADEKLKKEFKNLITSGNKSPFNVGEDIRFTPTAGLTNNTTYWWRVRASDTTGSGAWGEWSEPTSITASSSVSYTTWYQTTYDQFARADHEGTEASSSVNGISLVLGGTAGTTTSQSIDFAWRTYGNAWGELAWSDTEVGGSTVVYHLEYQNGGVWETIPDSTLSGNEAGFTDGPVSLLGLDTSIYSVLRIRAELTSAGTEPILRDWKVSWGLAVEQPIPYTLFDNEKTGTTTPSFTFYSYDPLGGDLAYQIQFFATTSFAGSEQTYTDTYNTAGYYAWTVPAGVATATVACWGGGGGGGDGASGTGGGGGGGGAYAASTIDVTPGITHTIYIGAGGVGATTDNSAGGAGEASMFATTTVVATGGTGGSGGPSGSNPAGGAGGTVGASTGDVRYAGGAGGAGNGASDGGGGGGGSAGPDGGGVNGGDASATIGGVGGAGDNGAGGAGGIAVTTTYTVASQGASNVLGGGGAGGGDNGTRGGDGGAPGGGGGGGEINATTGFGDGGSGQCRVTYTSSFHLTDRSSDADEGFADVTTPSDTTSPFPSGDTIRFTVQPYDAFTNGDTYWWRVRAIATSTSNTWSVWSAPQSFTVATSTVVSTWHQTTDEQFEGGTLTDLEATDGALGVASTIREALVAYAQIGTQFPRYRLWNGTSWSSESSATNVGEHPIYWIQTVAAPTRHEYGMATMGLSGKVTAQVYDGAGTSAQWGDQTTIVPVSSNTLYRGFDVAYEETSGDLMAASCSGTDAVSRMWDGSGWDVATTSVDLSFTTNCEWLQLASDPTSNEIILLARANIAETPTDYEAIVWNGSSWDTSTRYRIGSSGTAGYEAMAVEYEESGGDGVIVVGNGASTNFLSLRWNGSSWTGTTTPTIGQALNKALLKRDVGTDRLIMPYVDAATDIGYAEWSGSLWTTYLPAYEGAALVRTNNVTSAEYETVGGRDGNVLFVYNDSATTLEHYRTWDHITLSGEGDISTIGESPVVVTTRTGDGTILMANFDDDATEYDFSYWNGSGWSAEQVLNTNSIPNVAADTEPLSLSARRYTVITSGTVVSDPIDFHDGSGPGWDALSWQDSTPDASDIRYQVQYSSDDGETWSPVEEGVLSGNAAGFTTGPVSLANMPYTTYDLIRLVGTFTCVSGKCPTLYDWSVTWAAGLAITGTAQQYDLSSNVATGTVAVAVNGVLQGETGEISNGTWSIQNVTFFPGDTITVWIDNVDDAYEAVAVAEPTGPGNLTGIKLYERHLSIGSGMATTTGNAQLAQYDNGVSGDEDIFFDVDGDNDLSLCVTSGCADAGVVVLTGNTYRPDSANDGTVNTHDIRIDGTLRADGNAFVVSGSWDNNATSTMDTSTVTFTATSSEETIDSTGAFSSSFNAVTFGQGSGNATWTLASLLDVNGALTLSYGTLSASTSALTLAGNFSIGANAVFTKGTGTTTFDGVDIAVLTDAHTTVKQDLGQLQVNGGTGKIVRLGAGASTTNLTIATGNTFDVTSNNYPLSIAGDFRNTGTFTSQGGAVFFTATAGTRVVSPGPSAFAHLVFDGAGGHWGFPDTTVTVTRDFVIRNGTVDLPPGPDGTLAVGWSFTVTGGQFVHNNGTVKMTSTAPGRIVTSLDSPFYTLNFFGSGGAWSFGQANATTSGDFLINLGSVALPTGELAVEGDFRNEAGSFTAGAGTVHLVTTDTQKTLKTQGSALNHLLATGASGGVGSWYNTLWQYRVPVTIQQSVIDADLTDFPVYVNLADLGTVFWSTVQEDGDDIRVTTSDGATELPFELVSIATTTKTGELYFKAPSVSSTTNSVFYVYYSNGAASGYASTSAYGSQNVWTNGYDTVLHLKENPAGTAPQMRDVTTYAHHGTTGDSPPSNRSVSGKFGNAFDMSGVTYYLDFVNSNFTNYTYSMWLKPNSYTNGGVADGNGTYFMDRQTGSSQLASLKAVGGAYAHQYRDDLGTGIGGVSAGSIKTNGEWQFVAWGRTFGTNFFAHTDGTTYTSTPSLGALTPADPRLGNHQGTGDPTDYDGVVDEVRIANTARSSAWLKAEYWNGATTSTFYATSTPESYVARVFLDTNATVQGNTTIGSGLVVFPTGTLTLNGSFTNASGASFNANGGTVLFSAVSTGHMIDPGNSSFATTTFNSASGGWTLNGNATSTGPWSLTNATNFTASSGKTIVVGGTFINSIPSATTWTGSTLKLLSGTSYTIGSRTQAPEVYGTLVVGPNTDVRMWQSTSTVYTVDSTGSLYSQDHGAVDGALYIWGSYEKTSGIDYWNQTVDFEGTGIAGAPRPVAVRFASGASARFATGTTLEMVGGAGATTTLANQGSGSYALSVTSGTINAQYYAITNTDVSGLALLGSTTVTSLSDGAYTLTYNGGSMVTVSSSTIEKNPAPTFQIQRNVFATSSGITSGVNVTAATSTSYWTYRNHSGNRAGESYDSDTGNPGNVRWDDSGYTISVSGNVYVGEGTTTAPSVCNGSTAVVRIVVQGTASTSVPCTAGTGAFTFNNSITFSGDAVLTAYLDTNGGAQAVTVTRSPSGSLTGFNLYQNSLIVRHEGVDPLTITQLAMFDTTHDTDVPFTASSTTATLAVKADRSLYVWAGKTFTPGGNVTLLSGGTGTSYDGTLRLAATSTFVAQGSESHSVGGSWVANSDATFTSASSTVTFTGTTTGKTIAPSSSFYNLTLNGTNGGWNIASSTTIAQNFAVDAGTATGTANVTVQNGALSGNGTIAMTGGTIVVGKGGTFGGTSDWTFNNLTLGDGTTNTTTKAGSGNVSVLGTLSVLASHTLSAGGANWTLRGTGAVLSVAGTFSAQTSTTTFAGTGVMTVPALAYHNLVLAAPSGSPTYTFAATTLSAETLTVGDGVNAVTAQANSNNPLITVSGSMRIRAQATYQSAGSNDLRIGGSYTNQGTFVGNSGGVVFNSTDTGEVITPGTSAFHHLTINGAGGGWTLAGGATTTGNLSLTAGASFAVQTGSTVVVQGIFFNEMGGALTDWSDSTLYLNTGTSIGYPINGKTTGADSYGTLRIGANTDISMWNSTSTVYRVDSTGSLYSMDHNGTDGALYLWGDYVRSAGNEYWSHATDFDGTDLSFTASERLVSVYLADGATTTLSGGTWNITGASYASTSIQAQGSGAYALRVTGGTFSAQYYTIRGINAQGLVFSGSPTVSQLSDGDLLLTQNGGTMLSVMGTVIDANPAKLWQRITFATSTGVVSGYNASSSGTSASSWRFNPGYGNYYGEAYDNDSASSPNPGYLVWSDSATAVSVTGKVYSDEGVSASGICNGSSKVVRLYVEKNNYTASTSCAVDGTYTFSDVQYDPGNTVLVYLASASTEGASVTADPVSGIAMDIYEHRLIVRHEDTEPITIADMSAYDSDNDAYIPFDADLSPNTLTTRSNTKLIVWASKTFEPGGSVTLLSGGTGTSYDGTFELQASAVYRSSTTSTETIVVGGSWLTGSGASFTAGSSTVTFTATTTGKTVSPDTSAFNNLVFNGSGGAWTFADVNATTTGNFTVSAGNVTVASSTLAVGGSFTNSAVMSAASTTFRFIGSGAQTIAFNGNSVGSLLFTGAGSWNMTDTNATSTGSVTISAGSVTLPSGTFAVANGFANTAGSFTHGGTLRLYGSLAAQTLRFGTSAVRNLAVVGTGSWAFADTNATTTGTTTVSAGGLTAPSGAFAVGGSFVNTATFNPNAGLLYLFATTTGQTFTAGSSTLSSVVFDGAGGGWTVTGNATSSNAWRLRQGASFTMASSTTLEVGGIFENAIGGSATNWTDSTLYLNASGTSYTVNAKTIGLGDTYAFLRLGSNTDVAMWNSSGATTTVHASSSLYSMDHATANGALYVYGEYVQSGSAYWSYAKDFDGENLALSSGERPVSVTIATSSSLTFTGGILEMVGTASATTTIAGMNSGTYTINKTGGSLYASYFSVRNMASAGMSISGAVSVETLANGDFELSQNAGVLLTIAGTVFDQKPSKFITGMRFASTSGVATGTNVRLTGTTGTYWKFTGHYGGFDGETRDDDGVDACGAVRWDNSTCLEVSQAHYRIRSDDGGEGAPSVEWYDADWGYRKRVTVSNPNASALSDYPVRLQVAYVTDLMESNYVDLRFTDGTGTTSLPYYIESYTSATATVWVKVPSLPASAGTSIFMYYDNQFAADAQSGADTFTLFEDFEDDLSAYDGDTTYFTQNSSFAWQKTYGLSAAAGHTADETPDGIYRTGTGSTFSRGSTIEFYQKVAASQNDEPCTLFGVQSPGSGNQNYALCLDQDPSDRVMLVKNVSSSDDSATTVLASSTVTYTSQWYKVRVDWLVSNTINVTVYNANGTTFTSLSATDTSSPYTSGGMGFSFWYQAQGWDFYTVRPYAASAPTHSFGTAQVGGGASWTALQDTPTSVDSGTNFRVRMSVENSGGGISGKEFRLQYAPRTEYLTCAAVPDTDYDDVPIISGCGVHGICMVASPQFVDQDPTTQHLDTSSGLAFTPGHMVEENSNQSNSMSVGTSTLTELEYAVELTSFANDSNYCLRTTDGGMELDSYANIAEVSVNGIPTVTEWSLNGGRQIFLTEGDTTTVYATGTVSDVNGNIVYATSTFYRSGVGQGCTADPNNCYHVPSCSLDCPGDGTVCEVSCSADLEYFAEPTDGSAETWQAHLFVADDTDNTGTSTSEGVELRTMLALGVISGEIGYGSLGLGQDTGGFNINSQVQNSGNAPIDIEVEGSDLTNGASNIPVENQVFATGTFNYASYTEMTCDICHALSDVTSPVLEVDLPKPTSTSTLVVDDLFWGIYVPTGTAAVTHQGQTTFYAVGD